jgi:GNAT superfamily N-acetyltransferase
MDIKEDIIYSVARTTDFEGIYTFHRQYFGEIRSMYIWNWQYGDINPNKSVLIVGKINDKIIASQGAFAVDLVIKGKVYPTGKNESLLIEPEYRKKGVYTKLYEFAFEEYKKAGFMCIWGFTKAQGPFKNIGFSFDIIIARSILPLDFKVALKLAKVNKFSAVKAFAFKVASIALSAVSNITFTVKAKTIKLDSTISIYNKLKSESDISTLFSFICKTQPELIHINFNESYLNWRIGKSPNKIFCFYAYSGDELQGYLFLEKSIDYFDILDFTFLSKSAGSKLMKALFNLVHEERIGFISYSGNTLNSLNQKAFNFLHKFGFYRVKGPNGFVLKIFKNIESSMDLKNWYITSLWYEGI